MPGGGDFGAEPVHTADRGEGNELLKFVVDEKIVRGKWETMRNAGKMKKCVKEVA